MNQASETGAHRDYPWCADKYAQYMENVGHLSTVPSVFAKPLCNTFRRPKFNALALMATGLKPSRSIARIRKLLTLSDMGWARATRRARSMFSATLTVRDNGEHHTFAILCSHSKMFSVLPDTTGDWHRTRVATLDFPVAFSCADISNNGYNDS